MTAELPTCKTLELRRQGAVLHVTLNRPEVRNAMSLEMVQELQLTLEAAESDSAVRTLVLRGAGGHFCAGADIRDMAAARTQGQDAVARTNRAFGTLITRVDGSPLATVAVLEGAVMGGGLGLACVVDVAVARADASFRLPETGLGLPPAQIAAFLVRRLGLSQARRLAVTGGRMDGREAAGIGLVHRVFEDGETLEQGLARLLGQINRCAPGAIAVTKELMRGVGQVEHETLLDRAAARFAEAVQGPEGIEGMTAFMQKRKPSWEKGQ